MRISTGQVFQQQLAEMQRQQAQMRKTELQIASGMAIMKPSDDPAGAVKILNIESNIFQIDQYARNTAAAESALGLEESILQAAGNALQRIKVLSIQGNNPTLNDNDRNSIAQEIGQRFEELVALANTRNANGEYIFGGFRTGSPPFVNGGTAVNYAGDQGQRMLQIGEGVQVATGDSGRTVFQEIPSGNGRIAVSVSPDNTGTAVAADFGLTGPFQADDYTITFSRPVADGPITYEVTDSATPTPNVVSTGTYKEGSSISFAGVQLVVGGTPADGDTIQAGPSRNTDLFGIVKNIEQALLRPASNPAGAARLHNDMAAGLANLDQAIDHLSNQRAKIGARLNNIETMKGINDDFKLQLQTVLSQTRDLDVTEAILRFNQQLGSLQAAQQVFASAAGLSLFQFL